jgi:transmembrane 9 superfamily protein 2/4
MVFMLNLFLIGSGASGAVPFGTMLAVLALYFLISGPLCVAGYYYGMRHGVSRSRLLSTNLR